MDHDSPADRREPSAMPSQSLPSPQSRSGADGLDWWIGGGCIVTCATVIVILGVTGKIAPGEATSGTVLIGSLLAVAALAERTVRALLAWAGRRRRIRQGALTARDLRAVLATPRYRWRTSQTQRRVLGYAVEPYSDGGRGTNSPMAVYRCLAEGVPVDDLVAAVEHGADDAALRDLAERH